MSTHEETLALIAERQKQAMETRARIERERALQDQTPNREFGRVVPTTLVEVAFESAGANLPTSYQCVGSPTLLNGFLHLETVFADEDGITRQRVTLSVARLVGWTETPIEPVTPAPPVEEEPEPEEEPARVGR